MKTTKYQAPAIKITKVRPNIMAATSLYINSVGGDAGITMGDDDNYPIPNTADSRRNRYWDDEEDEFDF